jgi:hypothetical protein
METSFGALCDDFYVSNRLYLKLDLTLSRETVLHFFDRIRKEYPQVGKMRVREDGALMLEEDQSSGPSRRWLRLEPASLKFGYFAPPTMEEVQQFGGLVLEQAPYHLTFSDLDYDHLEVVYGFDLEYRGNHDQLVGETLYADHPMAAFLMGDESYHIIDGQPYFGISLTPQCDIQAYIEVKSRTSTFEVRTNEYEGQMLSVFLTVRKYWGFSANEDLNESYAKLMEHANRLATDRVAPLLVNPLAQAIASRP